MKLVIVESPAKAKTIEGYLGKGYKVMASYGHVRDLPKSKIGIDLETFEPQYVIPTKARKNVNLLKKEAEKATQVILATDEDREGEAIAWHLVHALGLESAKPKDKKIERIVFHEITKEAITNAAASPRALNGCLVDAQQGRRVLDRLVGYNLSPLLWKKIRRGLSAGRVQSVAVKLIVDREREIQAFKPEEYWEVFAELIASADKDKKFEAKLTKKDGKNFEIKNAKENENILIELEKANYLVSKVEEKEQKRNPAAPFITSSLQQEAARKLRFSAKKTMMVAQKLYEGIKLDTGSEGLITYMRTDSLNLSSQAVDQARKYIKENFGAEYLPSAPRVYKKKKGAQEAHEAIRPTNLLRTPESIKGYLSEDEQKLYELIWQRTLASQMTEEVLTLTGVDIAAGVYTFRANGKKVKFDGFSRVYLEGKDEEIDEKDVILPNIKDGDKCNLDKLRPEQKFTKPPARYSEATLVRVLEENGIGRPSTYAPTLSTIKDRGYVRLENRYFIPEEVGFIVNDMLVENFPEIVNIDFTAKMEEELDEVAEGCRDWKVPIREFWIPFSKTLEAKGEAIEKINMDEETDEICEKCGKPMIIKAGRFGKFLACTGFPDCKNTKAIKTTTGQKCPTCKEGDIVVKKTKKGRTFWGCSRYPDCDWASWQAPKTED
jgi:DNA topoisomerase I